jgi:hypothetical protein
VACDLLSVEPFQLLQRRQEIHMSKALTTIDSNQLELAGGWSLKGFAAGTDGLIPLTSTELGQVTGGGYFKDMGAKWGGAALQTGVTAAGVAAASTPWGRGAALGGYMLYKLAPSPVQSAAWGAGVAAWETLGWAGSKAGGWLGEKLDNALGS